MNKMTIGIDGGNFIPGTDVQSGIQRVVDGFVQNEESDTYFHYYFFDQERELSRFLRKKLRYHKLPKKGYSKLFLPFSLLKDNISIFLAFSGYIPGILNYTHIKSIAFVYDFGFIKYPQLYHNPDKLKADTDNTVHRADKIVVLSNYTRRELLSSYPEINPQNVIQLYAGIDHITSVSVTKPMSLSQPYFLYVGVIKPVKRVLELIHIYTKFKEKTKCPHKLILIGNAEPTYLEKINNDTQYSKYKEDILFKLDVADQHLVQYYSYASAVLNNSLEEGFCFPVLEALALGKTVITNNIQVYKEYVPYFPQLTITKNEENFIESMISSVTRKEQRSAIQVPDIFTWNNFAQKIMEIIKIL